MKRAFLWAFLTWFGALLLSLVVCLVGAVTLDPERLGEIGSNIGLFLGLVVFIVVWIRDANRQSLQPSAPPSSTPEKLEPIDYSRLAHIRDDSDRKA